MSVVSCVKSPALAHCAHSILLLRLGKQDILIAFISLDETRSGSHRISALFLSPIIIIPFLMMMEVDGALASLLENWILSLCESL